MGRSDPLPASGSFWVGPVIRLMYFLNGSSLIFFRSGESMVICCLPCRTRSNRAAKVNGLQQMETKDKFLA